MCIVGAGLSWRTALAESLFGQGSNPGAATEVRLVYETDPNPPRYLGEGTAIDWEKPGLTLEVLRLVGEQLDVDFLFQRVPWKRGLFLVQNGLADGIFHASYKAGRESFAVYPRLPDGTPDESRAIFLQSYVAYVTKGSPVGWDGRAFSGLDGPVGAVASYSVVGDLRELGVAVEEERSRTINLRKLVEGRIAAHVDLETMADPAIASQEAFATAVEKLHPPFRTKPYFLIFSHQFYEARPDLAERIWDGIAAANASAEFNALVELYE